MFQLALLAILIATPITFTYLNIRCDNLSKDIAVALNKTLNKRISSVLHLPENQPDAKSMHDLVTLVLSSRSLRSVAYFQNNHYIYSDRNTSLHTPISPSLIERLKKINYRYFIANVVHLIRSMSYILSLKEQRAFISYL